MIYEERQKQKAEQLAKHTNRPIFDELPEGWKRVPAEQTTAPTGYYWAHNCKSLFSKERKTALIKDGNYWKKI